MGRLEEKRRQIPALPWTSTSTKNLEYSDILYVQELIGRPTVSAMSVRTMEAYLDHGRPEETEETDARVGRSL